MSKIVIDARELRTSSGRYVERLLHYLQQTNSEHEFVVLLTEKDFASWQPTAANFTSVVCPYKEFTFGEQLGYLRQVTALQADLVHFAFAQQPVFYRGKTVTTFHDLTTLRFTNPDKNPLIFKLKQQVYGQVIKRAARKSAAIITPSEFVKSDLVDYAGISADKVTVTYEAADPISETPTALPDLLNKRFIMYVGRPTPHKNLERLIEAFALLRPTHPDLTLVLAGKKDANYRRIEAGVAPELRPHILFTDYISEGQLRWLYENCAAYVFPSLSEGFGLPGLEAMCHGAPVISSRETCLPEIYGNAAHYFNPLDVNAIALAITQVLEDAGLHQKLIAFGRQQVLNYSWQRTAEQTLTIYDRALR